MMEEEQNLRENNRSNLFRDMIIVDCTYISRNWIGRVKLIEFIFVTLAGIILPSTIGLFFTRFAFFTFVSWTSFIYIVIDLLLHVMSLWRRLPMLMTSSSILIILLVMGAISFLIASSLVADASYYLSGSASIKAGIAAACGFVVMILYGVEVFLHYRVSRGESTATDNERPRNPARNRPISHPIMVEIADPPPYKESGGESTYVPPSTFH